MKRKLISIIALIFAANLCFSAVFNDKTFEEVFTEDIEEALEYLEIDVETLKKDFYPQNVVAKEFVLSLPTEITASPMLNPVQDENGDYQIAYTLLIETKDFLASVYNLHKEEDGLHCAAQLYINLDEEDLHLYVIDKPYAVFSFNNFIMHNDGTVESGLSKEGVGQFDIGTDMYFSNTYLEKAGDSYIVVCEEPSLITQAFFEMELIRVGKTVFDMGVNVLSCEPYNESQSFYTDVLDYGATFTSVRWDDGQFYANGQLNAPGIDLYADFTDYAIIIGPADFLVEDSEGEYSFSYMDYTFFGKNLQISPREVVLNDAGIVWKDKKIPFGKMKFDGYDDEWKLLNECYSGSVDEDYDIVPILCDDDEVTNYYFDDEGLAVQFSTRFPKAKTRFFPYAETYYAHVDADGTFYPDLHYYYDYPHFAFEDIIIRSEYVSANTEKFHCNYAKFDMPKNSCLTGVQVYDLDIGFDGTVDSSENYNFPTCYFCGMPYKIDEMEFVNDGFMTSGTLQLPSTLPDSYSGMNLTVNLLYVGFDGSVKELVTGSSTARGCSLGDDFWLVSKGCHIEFEQTRNDDGNLNPAKCWLCLEDSTLEMPNGYKTSSAISMDNVKYDLTAANGTGGFDFDDVWVPGGFTMGISGMQLYVVDGTGMENGLQFTGMLSLPNGDEVPEFLRGMETPAVIGIDFDGKICRSEVALGLLEGSLETANDEIGAFTLGNTAAHFATSEFDPTYLALVADSGSFVFTDALPSWLAGKEVRIGSFVYDFSVSHYTSLSGMQYLWDAPAITPEMTGVYATIDYSYTNPDEDSLIAITGDLVSPAPVSWGDSTPETQAAKGTISFDLAGRTKDFSVQYEY